MKYQIKNWETNFEGSKSKGYDNKTSCSMPCKHGLGYRHLIKMGGADCFGAWCALIQVLSRHGKPRNGYCTTDGTENGAAYGSEDLEILTGISSKTFDKMFKLVCLDKISWAIIVDSKDTAVPCQGTIVDQQGTKVPLNSDSDSDSDLNKDSKRGTLISFGEFHRVKLSQVEYDKVVERFGSDSQRAIEMLDGYIEQGNKAKYRNHYAVFRKDNWIWNKIKFGGITGKPKGTRSEDFI